MTDSTVASREEHPGRALAELLRNWWESSARGGREKPTQNSLAKRLGVDQTTLSRYLNPAHASNAPRRIVEQLHSVLRAPADDLVRACALADAAAGAPPATKRPAPTASPDPASAATESVEAVTGTPVSADPTEGPNPAARWWDRSPVAFPTLAVSAFLLLVLGCLVWWVVPTTGRSDTKATAKVSDRPSEGTDWPLARKGNVLWKARTVQHLLRANGLDVKVDADYGPATAEAVKKFQAAHGLTVDGKVGKDTWPLLIVTIDSRTTKPEAVKAVQYLLHSAGVPTDTTGAYTPSTMRSLKEFQASRALPVTGIGDEDTWRALLNAQGPDQHK
ncbi:peptidoglycan-binding protein [Streptomyces sp. BE133]|uniref:peptidoglycan-binding protein n=1 Tax=Streptomyces sp. BE133 TaxID=3002523 RepID=UPI002E782611|nr:peptidoglycan-binding protein [Streptomyces sp. BE133]MEE1807387.1 peptidoglycan-binding protein [Streptomyces sp. BE133]